MVWGIHFTVLRVICGCFSVVFIGLISSLAIADGSEDALEWARKKNDEYLKNTGIVSIDIDMKCTSRSFLELHDVEVVDGVLTGPRYKFQIFKPMTNRLAIKGTVKLEGSRLDNIWFSGPLTNGQFVLSGQWLELDKCEITGSIENDEKLPIN